MQSSYQQSSTNELHETTTEEYETEFTAEITTALQHAEQSNAQWSVNTAIAHTTKTDLVINKVATTTPSVELVITSPPPEQDSLKQTMSVESSTIILNPYGRQDQFARSESDDTVDGILGNTAMVAGIASAAGVAILAPLLVFVLKSLCRGTKVVPTTDG